MKIHSFTNFQSGHLAKSLTRQLTLVFDAKVEKIENLLDAEIKRQIETSTEVQEYREERELKLANYQKAAKLHQELSELDLDLVAAEKNSYSCNVPATLTNLLNDEQAFVEKWNKNLESDIKDIANKLARRSLNINQLDLRKTCLADDIRARLAVMAYAEYDTALDNMLVKIDIEDYFITL